MKIFLFLLIVTASININSQTNRDVIISFWDSNIQAIVNLDQEKIIEQTNFPVGGSWGYAMELESSMEKWSKEDFISNISKIFNEETRDQLKQKTYNDLVHYKNDDGVLELIINVNFQTKMEGSSDTIESSTIFFFKMFENKWKLYSIEYTD